MYTTKSSRGNPVMNLKKFYSLKSFDLTVFTRPPSGKPKHQGIGLNEKVRSVSNDNPFLQQELSTFL